MGARVAGMLGALLLVAAALALVGCELIDDTPRVHVVGGRQLIVPVNNNSDRPAVLVIAGATLPIGPAVGTAQPAVVPPKTRVNVVFTVPGTLSWALFVNPSPGLGPLIVAQDVQGCIGVLQFEIDIGPRVDDVTWGGDPEPGCGDVP